ncbi:hypothetical protein GCM10020220_088340 [Nonomuraea rubra]
MEGLMAGEAGIWTGSRPDGFTRPLSTPASAAPPSTPGRNAWIAAATRSLYGPSAYGRPDTTTSTVGVPVASTRLDQVRLEAGQPQVRRVAALARGAAAEQPGPVADEQQRQVAPSGQLGRPSDARAVVAHHVGPDRVAQVGVRELLRQPFPDGGDRQAHAVLGVAVEDVVGEGVAAQQRARVVGARPMTATRAVVVAGWSEAGEDAGGVAEQDDGTFRDGGGEGGGERGLSTSRFGSRFGSRFRSRFTASPAVPACGEGGRVAVEEAELDLLPQDPPHDHPSTSASSTRPARGRGPPGARR